MSAATQKISVVSVNLSQEKGTQKRPVPSATLDEKGMIGDAHAGSWHRQVTMLALERIEAFARESGRKTSPGDFAENITTSGIDLLEVGIFDRFRIGDAELEVTQIGKECHGDGCAIFREVGKCVMPKEGIFCRVLKGGVVRPGDRIEYLPRKLQIRIITLSDRASRGEYQDASGPAIVEMLEKHFASRRWKIDCRRTLIPDDPDTLRKKMKDCFSENADIVITCGGTGIGPRDITPDVIRPMLDREIPGIMEHIRIKYGEKIPSSLLSRSVAGIAGGTMVYCVPGSVKAAKEYMAEILRTMEHAMFTLHGVALH